MTGTKEQTMLIVGDVFIRRDDPPSVFQHIRDLLRGADFKFGNLEGAVADSGKPWPKGSTAWKSGASNITAVESIGFDAMTVANNHIMDYGHDAMFETLGQLDRIGIKHTGAGRNIAEAHKAAIVEHDGCRVALLGYTCVFMTGWEAGPDSPGLAVMRAQTAYQPHHRIMEVPGSPPTICTWMLQESKDRLAQDIAAARAQADIVVCTFHWGVSGGYIKLTDYQVELGRHAIDSGADMVFGHHSHCVQGIEVHKGKPIFYSLGNLSFAQHTKKGGHELETLIIRCKIRDKKIVSVEYLPTRGDEHLDPHVLDLQEGKVVSDLVEARSAAFGTRFAPTKDAIQVVI